MSILPSRERHLFDLYWARLRDASKLQSAQDAHEGGAGVTPNHRLLQLLPDRSFQLGK